METCTIETPLGELVAGVENDQLVGLWFTTQKHFPKNQSGWTTHSEHPVFIALKQWLKAYFKGEWQEIPFKLNPKGTDFQKMVWKYLLQIPQGQTRTYGEIAKSVALEMGRASMSAQAVGGAIGSNPISIVIPCHRVIGANRQLTGYDGGLDKKEALLKLEKAI